MENNQIVIATKADRTKLVAEMEKAGFAALRSGLGVSPGKYVFTTPNSESIYATKPIESAKGKFGLTLVAGVLKGSEAHNSDVNNTYGLTAADKQFVVTLDQFLAIEPNQSYEVVINDKSRIASMTLVSEETLETA